MKSVAISVAILSLFSIFASQSFAVPLEINYQGYLTSAGVPVNVSTNMTFKLYDDLDALQWDSGLISIDVSNGVYIIILGATAQPAINPAIFAQDLWLGITVGGDAEMTPKQKLTSVSYSIKAGSAEVADSVIPDAITSIEIATWAVGTDEIADGSVTIDKIDGGAVGNEQILDNAITGSQISDGSLTNADISATALISASKIDDGAASGLDSDLLDGMNSTDFATFSHLHSTLEAADGSPADALTVDNSGNIGIGQATPSAKLEVAGDGKFISGPANPTNLSVWDYDSNRSVNLRQDTDGNSYLSNKSGFFGNSTTGHGALILWGDGIRLNYGSAGNAGDTALSIHNKTPSVGIGGGHTPTARLDIAGIDTGIAGLTVRGGTGNSHLPYSDGQIYLTTDVSTGASGSGDFFFRTYDGTIYSDKLVIRGTTGELEVDTDKFVIKGGAGNVGIGTATPGAKLDIRDLTMIAPTTDGIVNIGNTPSYHITIDADEIQSRNGSNPGVLSLNNYGGNVVMNRYGGNVGVGTYSPSEKLTVEGTIESSSGGFKFPDATRLNSGLQVTQTTDALCQLYFITGNTMPDLCFSCSDGFDNDGDGFIDYPDDPDCTSARDRWENMVAKQVFVTSTNYNGNLGGVSGADAKCMDRAAAAQLEGTFKAWISDGLGNTPNSTFVKAAGPYALLDGTIVANNYTDLTDGTILQSPNKNEFGVGGYANYVWTDTSSSGDLALASIHCNNWTSSSEFDSGMVGDPGGPGHWTQQTSIQCLPGLSLYCFEQ